MQIQTSYFNTQSFNNTTSQKQEIDTSYKEAVNNFLNESAKTSRQSDISDEDVQKFLHDLRTKGAAKFLADLNEEKIEKKVEEYKQKLLKDMGDSPEALKEIATLVEAYKKQLLEELQNGLDADEKKIPINKNALAELMLKI